jgi:hypothetical protein
LKALFDPTPCPPDFFENASFDTLYSHWIWMTWMTIWFDMIWQDLTWMDMIQHDLT